MSAITWEILEDLEILSVHDKSVALVGYDEEGNEYTATGTVSCDELVEVEEIEPVKK